MSLHDTWARTTPYELLFPEAGDAAALVERIDADAERTGADPRDLRGLLTLGSVAAFLRALAPAEEGAESIHRYGVLLRHALAFHRAGCPLYLLTTPATRRIVAASPDGGAPELPAPAGYLQLPRHLVWTGGPDAPESVDGMFWTLGADGVLDLLVALGMHAGRPGLGVVSLPEAPWEDAAIWLEAPVRPEGEDFATTLPGGDLDELYSLVTAGEAFKLFARACLLIAGSEGVAGDGGEAGGADAHGRPDPSDPDQPRPSRLAWTRVSASGDS